MIEWLRRNDPDQVFLRSPEGTWTYGATLTEVEKRLSDAPRLSIVTLRPESIFDLIAGVSSGGITAVGRRPETTRAFDADLVVFTSGSTGAPKGVRLSRLNLTAAAAASSEHLGHGPKDDWLLAMPMHHVGGISIVVRQAYTGGSITMLPEFDPVAFAAAMKEQVTMVSVVPTMLARLLDYGPFSGLRAVLVGGGPIPPGLLEAGAQAGLPVLPTYGMTETFGQVATLRPGAPLAYKAHPLPGIEFRTDGDGRIAVKGPQVSSGYAGELDRPDPWFVTNDLGEIDDEGALRLLGRADTVIVTGGENVNPERVESVLRAHTGVDEAVVVGVPDTEWGERVVCVYAGSADTGELLEWVAGRLPAFMVPKRFVLVDSLPRTALGKPDRSAVGELL
ncbi:MAG: AMP-binding protein [Acidimicrobiia bacterium]|jgi:O-succinylbenzoic acid--CoA ligase